MATATGILAQIRKVFHDTLQSIAKRQRLVKSTWWTDADAKNELEMKIEYSSECRLVEKIPHSVGFLWNKILQSEE